MNLPDLGSDLGLSSAQLNRSSCLLSLSANLAFKSSVSFSLRSSHGLRFISLQAQRDRTAGSLCDRRLYRSSSDESSELTPFAPYLFQLSFLTTFGQHFQSAIFIYIKL